jgi:hypothetical protein
MVHKSNERTKTGSSSSTSAHIARMGAPSLSSCAARTHARVHHSATIGAVGVSRGMPSVACSFSSYADGSIHFRIRAISSEARCSCASTRARRLGAFLASSELTT